MDLSRFLAAPLLFILLGLLLAACTGQRQEETTRPPAETADPTALLGLYAVWQEVIIPAETAVASPALVSLHEVILP